MTEQAHVAAEDALCLAAGRHLYAHLELDGAPGTCVLLSQLLATAFSDRPDPLPERFEEQQQWLVDVVSQAVRPAPEGFAKAKLHWEIALFLRGK